MLYEELASQLNADQRRVDRADRFLLWLTIAAIAGIVAVCLVNRCQAAPPLVEMGLPGLTIMSDAKGLAVRGHGYCGCGDVPRCGHQSGPSSAAVFGNSFATIVTPTGDAHSENGYQASGSHQASGTNNSFAGSVANDCSTQVFAGGSSTATAN